MERYEELYRNAARYVEQYAEDNTTLMNAIEDRIYDEVDITNRTLNEGMAKFEIDARKLDTTAENIRKSFVDHGYHVYFIRDRRFNDGYHPERLLVVKTGEAEMI